MRCILCNMDIRSLELFLDLSRTLRFRETSRRCHLTPSALTRAIARLEEEVGAALFTRDQRSVRLTPDGVRFREYAQRALEEWKAFMADLRQESPLRGEITLYCSVTASYCVLPRLLWSFRQRYPEVSVTLRTGDAEHGIVRVSDGSADAALVPVPERVPAALDLIPLQKTPLMLIGPVRRCPLQEELAAGRPWTQLPLILPESGPAHDAIKAWFRSRKIKPNILAYVSGNEAILSMTSLGLGLGFVPRLVAEHAPKSIHVRYLDDGPELKPYIIALCTRRQSKNPAVPALREVASESSEPEE